MSKIATLTESTLTFIEKDLAFPGSIELTILISISSSQLFHSMCKTAAVLIWAVTFRDVVFAKFDLVVRRMRIHLLPLRPITGASLNRVIVIIFVVMFMF